MVEIAYHYQMYIQYYCPADKTDTDVDIMRQKFKLYFKQYQMTRIYLGYIKQIRNVLHSCNGLASLKEFFHLSTHENILTIPLVNIHDFYNELSLTVIYYSFHLNTSLPFNNLESSMCSFF